jgi:uncharacterized surface protein with fasciclin (FAS1) repeats
MEGAIQAANLTQNVTEKRDVTVFAPSNEAFRAIGSVIEDLIQNKTGNGTGDRLRQIVGYHVVDGTVAYTSGLGDTTLKSDSGPDIHVRVVDGDVYANSARVIVPDILCANGVIHVIDQSVSVPLPSPGLFPHDIS